MGRAETNYPGVVRIASDTPHLKAGGTDPFAAPRYWPQWTVGLDPFTAFKLRRAHRHGGAIPWTMVKERPNPITYVLPAPAAGSLYMTEVAGHGMGSPPNWPSSPDWFHYDVTRKNDGIDIVGVGSFPTVLTATPKPILAAYLNATTDAEVAAMMVRPEAPTLSADDWYWLYPTGEYHLFSGPAAVAAIGHMDRMTLMKPTVNGLNTKTLSAQVQYVCRVAAGSTQQLFRSSAEQYGATWDGTNWIIDRRYFDLFSSPYYDTARMYGGWACSPECDPATGKVIAATSMPEGAAWNLGLRGAFDLPSAVPVATAITWPTGVRKVSGTYAGAAGGAAPRLVWRPAERWRARIAFQADPSYRWSNADGSALGIPVFNGVPSFGDLFRGYYASEAAAAETSTGAWKTLCTFSAWSAITGDLGAPTWGVTLPTAGQEIIITGWHGSMHVPPLGNGEMRIYFYPDATVSPTAIPLMLDGVVQGGTL